MEGSRTLLVLIDNQAPLPLGHHRAKLAQPPGLEPEFQRSERRVLSSLDEGRIGTGMPAPNGNLNVRSVLSCPLNDTRMKLAGTAGNDPATFRVRAGRSAN